MKYFCAALWIFIFLAAKTQNNISWLKIERVPVKVQDTSYQFEIEKGIVRYVGKQHAMFEGDISGKLPAAEWKRVLQLNQKYAFLQLPDAYQQRGGEIPVVNVSLMISGKRKTIRNALAGPEYLRALISAAEKMVKQKTEWEQKKSLVKPLSPPAKQAQSDNALQDAGLPDVFSFADVQPEFPGGHSQLMTFLSKNIRYPVMARDMGIQGKVMCSFIIDQEGNVQDVRVLRGIGGGCDEEALRVLRTMPRWHPGKQQGRAVKVKYQLPILFRLK